MLSSMTELLNSDEWNDPQKCPACDSQLDSSLQEHIREHLDQYEKVDELNQRVRNKWATASWATRLRKMEEAAALEVPHEERQYVSLDAGLRVPSPDRSDLDLATSRLAELEALRASKLALLSARRIELEQALPPSLVQLTEQVEHGSRLQSELKRYRAARSVHIEKEARLARLRSWAEFAKDACAEFSNAEVALSTAKTGAIEAQYREMYEEITKNPDVVPTLQKDDRTESLLLRLETFYGLSDLSAPTLLQESYRNALAISIFLSTALNHRGPARFVVLDDVTSSFDAGHQWHLMELLRNKIARPGNPDGPQLIVLSHDGLLEKYFDRMASEGQLHHQRLQGSPPSGFVLTQAQDANRLRTAAEDALNAGQVDKALPLVRQYLEYVMLGVIRSVQVPVPIDFSIRDDRKMVQNCLDCIELMVDTHDAAGTLILSAQQRHDLKNVLLPSIVSNWVSHYATVSGASITPHALLGVLGAVDDFAECFKYACTCAGSAQQRFYRSLTEKRCAC